MQGETWGKWLYKVLADNMKQSSCGRCIALSHVISLSFFPFFFFLEVRRDMQLKLNKKKVTSSSIYRVLFSSV